MPNITNLSSTSINNFLVQNLASKSISKNRYEMMKILKFIWPSLDNIDLFNTKIFFERTVGYSFDSDVSIAFGHHSPSFISKKEDQFCSFLIPLKGSQQITESENRLLCSFNMNKGAFLCGAEMHAVTDSIECIAIGLNPIKLTEAMRCFSRNGIITPPDFSRHIDFTDNRIRNLRDGFLKSLSAAGYFGIFDKVTSDMILRHCALILLASMGEELKNNSLTGNSQIIDRLCARLYSNIAETYTLSFMEAFTGLSGRVLQKEFLKRFGVSPFAWLNEQRLHCAKDLLSSANNNKTVAEISQECGFSHLGRFSGNFKNKFGIGAGSFKKSNELERK